MDNITKLKTEIAKELTSVNNEFSLNEILIFIRQFVE